MYHFYQLYIIPKGITSNVLCTLKWSTFLSVFMNILIKLRYRDQKIFHFKGFGMMNLHYEIRICQIIYNRVMMTFYVKCVIWFNVTSSWTCIIYLVVKKGLKPIVCLKKKSGAPVPKYTANIFEVIFTVFNCVRISTVISLYGLHFIAAPSTV